MEEPTASSRSRCCVQIGSDSEFLALLPPPPAEPAPLPSGDDACTQCGTALPTRPSRFCTTCGAVLRAAPAVPDVGSAELLFARGAKPSSGRGGAAPAEMEYTVTFSGGKLGLHLANHKTHMELVIVQKVDGEAAAHGILKGALTTLASIYACVCARVRKVCV